MNTDVKETYSFFEDFFGNLQGLNLEEKGGNLTVRYRNKKVSKLSDLFKSILLADPKKYDFLKAKWPYKFHKDGTMSTNMFTLNIQRIEFLDNSDFRYMKAFKQIATRSCKKREDEKKGRHEDLFSLITSATSSDQEESYKDNHGKQSIDETYLDDVIARFTKQRENETTNDSENIVKKQSYTNDLEGNSETNDPYRNDSVEHSESSGKKRSHTNDMEENSETDGSYTNDLAEHSEGKKRSHTNDMEENSETDGPCTNDSAELTENIETGGPCTNDSTEHSESSGKKRSHTNDLEENSERINGLHEENMIEHSDKRGNVSMEMSCGNGIGEDNGLSEYIEELRKELESNNSILNACKETKKRLLPILESVKSELCQLNSHTLKSEIFDSMELENQILRVMACYTVCKSM